MNLRKFMRKPHVKLAVIVAGLMVLLFVLWFVFGKGVGQDCSSDWDCFGFGTFCVSSRVQPYRYCTKNCETNADCPANFRCRRQPMIDNQDLGLKIENICVLDRD